MADESTQVLTAGSPASDTSERRDDEACAQPERIGRYRIVDELGRGGMGVVFAAVDDELGREVALKLVRPGHRHHESSVGELNARARREAQALAAVSHPNVVQVFEVGSFHGDLFIAMERVRGTTLLDWRRERSPAPHEVLAKLLEAGQGLAAVHAAGLVHRDFKPTNVMIGDDGRARVLDFGLARLVDDGSSDVDRVSAGSGDGDGQLTATGIAMGTPAYMAPEQHRGDEVGPAADQFAFAVAAWECMFGARPFKAESRAALLAAIEAHRVRPAPVAAPRLPAVERVLARALSARASDRYGSMPELLAALTRASRPQRLPWGSITVGAIALGTAAFAARPEEGVCAGRPPIDEVWAEPVRADLLARVSTSGYGSVVMRRIADNLDAYVDDWRSLHDETCAAIGANDDTRTDRRLACLQDELHGLAGLVAAARTAEAPALDRILEASVSWGGLARCRDPEALPWLPEDPDQARDVIDLRRRHAEALAWLRLQPASAGIRRCRELFAEAERIAFDPLTLEIERDLGLMLGAAGELDEAEQRLRRVFWAASASRADRLAASSVAELVRISVIRGEDAATEEWLRHGRTAAERSGSDDVLADLLFAEAVWHIERGRLDDAADKLEEAQALNPERLRAQLVLEQGNVELYRENFAAADAHYDEALELYEAALGRDHAKVGEVLLSRGTCARLQLRLDDAVADFARARAIFEARLGPRHPRVGALLGSLAGVAVVRDRPDEAIALAEQALAIFEAADPQSPDTVRTRVNLATMVLARDDLDRAESLARGVIDTHDVNGSPPTPELGGALATLADVQLRRGELDAAEASATRGLAILEGLLGPSHGMVAALRAKHGEITAKRDR